MSEDQILNEIEQHQEEYISFLQKMIQTESYNPPGNEKNVAVVIEEFLRDSEIKTEIHPFGDNRANLIAYLNDNFDGKNLLYNGHMDVVPPGNEQEWKYPPLSATIKGSKMRRKMFGRGTTDTKGGLAAMVIALKVLKKLNFKLTGNLILNAVADEETGGNVGTKKSLEDHLKSVKCDFIIVAEPGGFPPLGKGIVVGQKGHLILKVITKGISGHSMIPTTGKNAIIMMSQIIQSLDKIKKYMPKIIPPLSYEQLKELLSEFFQDKQTFEKILNEQQILQDLLYSLTHFTETFTMINGGIKENIIPDHCEGIINFRVLPGQSPSTIINALKKMIEEDLGYTVKSEYIGSPEETFVYVEVSRQGEGSYWGTWEKSQSIKDLRVIVEKIYGDKAIYFLNPGGDDAHYYRNSNYCENTVVFGPGSFRNAHTTNEFIEIKDFINAIKVYTIFAYNFLK